jgi:hypothetical protein
MNRLYQKGCPLKWDAYFENQLRMSVFKHFYCRIFEKLFILEIDEQIQERIQRIFPSNRKLHTYLKRLLKQANKTKE